MTEQQQLFEQIEDYLHERMSVEERLAFEQKMATDPFLADEVNEAKAIDEAIHFANLADLKKTIGEDIKKIKHTSKWKNLSYWLIGSAILIAVSAGLLLFSKDPKEKIAAVNPEKENVSSEKITGDKKQGSMEEEEVSTGKKNNSPGAISSSKETADDQLQNNESSEVIERTLPENKDKSTTENKETNASPVDRHSEEKKTNAAAPEVTNNCDKTFDIKTESSCKQMDNGSIAISTDGGKEFDFQVDQHIAKGSRAVFHNLSPGEHKVLVTYNKECTFTKTVNIEEKWCPLNQSFSFNPDYHEKWEIKYEDGAKGKFIIYDRSGKEIYKNTFGSGSEHWNGTDMNGNVVPIGTYAAILYYSDGRKEKVDLTIVR